MSNYISSKKLIAGFISDLNIQDTSFVNDMYRWIKTAIEIMEIPKYYIYKKEKKRVSQSRTTLPCDEQYITAIYTDFNNDIINDIINDTDIIYLGTLQRLIIRNNPLIGAGIQVPALFNSYGMINGNFLNTTFNNGCVLFIYKGLPCDEEGYPLVPNDAKVTEALQYWLIYKMSLSGYQHPVIKFNDALTLWNTYYPSARNSVNWFTPQEYQEFTEMWTNILIGDISNSYEL